MKGKDGCQPRALFGAALEIGLQPAHPLTSGVHCNSVILEDELAGRMIEAQRLQPLQVSRRPGLDSRWCLNRLPEQELGQPVHGSAEVVLGVKPTADQVPQSLVLLTWDPDGCEIAGTKQSGQGDGVSIVSFDPITSASGNQRRRHHDAVHPKLSQLAMETVASRASLVGRDQLASAFQQADRLVHCSRFIGDGAEKHGCHSVISDGDADGRLVHVQADIPRSNFFHWDRPPACGSTRTRAQSAPAQPTVLHELPVLPC